MATDPPDERFPAADAGLRAAFERAFDAHLLVDGGGAVVAANDAAADLFGRAREALRESAVDDLLADGSWQEVRTAERGSVTVARPDGSEGDARYVVAPGVVEGRDLVVFDAGVGGGVTERVAALLRSLNRGLVRATTREEAEEAACEALVEHSPASFAWVGQAGETGLVPRAWSGMEDGHLDAVAARAAEEAGPAEMALATGEVQVATGEAAASAVLREAEPDPNGRGAVVAVPLVHQDRTYGVLVAYGPDPALVETLGTDLLAEVGETVAASVHAHERKRGFQTDQFTALTLSVTDSRELFVRFSNAFDTSLSLERHLPQSDGSVRLLVAAGDAEVDPDALAGEFLDVLDASVEGSGEETRIEVHVRAWHLTELLGTYGASLRSLTAEDGRVEVAVHLPTYVAVSDFVGRFRSLYPESELRAKRSQRTASRSLGGVSASSLLTDRQLEVLETAVGAGYFESPRRNSGVEVADMLGISQPTFHEHLRTALRKLLTELIGTETE